MPRNKVSIDLDHVKEDSKSKTLPETPLKPKRRTKYTPVNINQSYLYGQSSFPHTIAPNKFIRYFLIFSLTKRS